MKGKSISKKVITLFMAMLLTICTCIPVFADAMTNPYDELVYNVVRTGKYTCVTTNTEYDFSAKRYKLEGGGYALYMDLINNPILDSAGQSLQTGHEDDIFSPKFDELKASAKKKLMSDVFTLVNGAIYDTEHGYYPNIEVAPTSDTGIEFMNTVSQQTGMASTMLSTILSETTPDYLTANRIYAPFSGVIGTILGLLAVLIMAFLGVTMGLDIAYITIPAVQMAFGGAENGGGQDGKGGFKASGLISAEAKAAVKAADGGGGQGGSGEYKAAVGIYFKYRWKGLVLLAICLLYLVQGEIYSLIGWFLDLFGGFLGQ